MILKFHFNCFNTSLLLFCSNYKHLSVIQSISSKINQLEAHFENKVCMLHSFFLASSSSILSLILLFSGMFKNFLASLNKSSISLSSSNLISAKCSALILGIFALFFYTLLLLLFVISVIF